ncbi:MAG: ABC transporter substrate-binding protein [Gammaproteobacteria bacterium]|nr:MAG: ABC transporter substrate-binding protein [Gammaproteobacteria bacterium]
MHRSATGGRNGNTWIIALAGLLAASLAGDAGAAPPQRIVSINICGDLLALSLAPRARIASVTFLAADPIMSPIASAADGVPLNYGKAEEVLALRPDLVLAGRYTARATVALLERLGYPVIEFDVVESLDDARSQIRTAAVAMGVAEAGEKMIAALDARIEATAAKRGDRRPLAAVYGPNGFTPGPRTLSGSLIELAGFENLAARAGIRYWGNLSLERLLLAQPDVLIVEARYDRAQALADQILAHPALDDLRDRITVAEVPRPLWSCPGPWIVDALDRLVAARVRSRRRARP